MKTEQLALTHEQELWVKALESGEYQQTTRYLHDKDGYCCLGVACELFKKSDWSYDPFTECYSMLGNRLSLQLPIIQKIGLNNHNGLILNPEIFKEAMAEVGFIHSNQNVTFDALSVYNDNGATFKQLAHAIRKHPELIFKQV